MFVHRSRWVEELAAGLAELVRRPPPGTDPLAPEIVAIQGRGAERWLSLRLADSLGVSANVQFPFPRQCVTRLLDAVAGEPPEEAALFDVEQSAFAIAGLLARAEDTRLGPVLEYVRALGPASELDVAGRVARVFDQYAVYRPDLLLRWERGPDDDWQAVLWRALSARAPGAHLPARIEAFRRRLARGLDPEQRAALPARVSFFGVTSLPPLYLELLAALRDVVDVHVFLLNPSDEWWADLRGRREQLRLPQDALPGELEVGGHPLLSELGRRSRDMQAVLERSDDYVEIPPPPAAPIRTGSLLHLLQDDMAALRDRSTEPREARPEIAADDVSIDVHSCHMPSRELFVLRELLADAFARDPSLAPHDVVVMAPSIEEYAPLIEGVFGAAIGGRPAIPFRVADRVGRDALPVVDSFLALLTFLTSRLRASDLFELLRRPVIASSLGLDEADLTRFGAWIADSGMRFGADADHRAREGLPATELNTIRFGLDRLLIGVALDGREDPPVFGGALPEPVDLGELDLLERFVAALDALLDAQRAVRGERPCGEWAPRLIGLAQRFCVGVAGGDREVEVEPLRSAIASVAESARRAEFDLAVPLSTFATELERRLASRGSSGGLFAGGITFCQLVPMRALPFRVVVLLGMDAEGFPRRDPRVDFDRMAQARRAGDPSPRDDDRQLFLEALLSARERLILTYVGQSAQDGAERPPSVLLSALLDQLGAAYRFAGVDPALEPPEAARRRLVVRHPLSRMSPRYFSGAEPRLFSYSEADCRAAAASLGPSSALPPFLAGAPVAAPEADVELSLAELVRRLGAPSRSHLELRYGLTSLRGEVAPGGDDPWEVPPIEWPEFGDRVVRWMLAGLDDEAIADRLWAQGKLPHGNPGRLALAAQLALARTLIERAYAGATQATFTLPVELDLGSARLRGSLSAPEVGPRVELRFGRVGAKQLLGGWVRHLAWLASGGVNVSRLAGVGGGGPELHELAPVDDARALLEPLVELARDLAVEPVALFPDISWGYVRRRRQPRQRAGALRWARRTFVGSLEGDRFQAPHPEDARLFADRVESLFGERGPFAETAEAVFGPLCDRLGEVQP